MKESIPWLVAIIVSAFGAGGVLTVLVSAATGRGGRRADVTKTLEDVAGKWVDRADERVDTVIAENKQLRGIVFDLMLLVEEAASTEGIDPEHARAWRARVMKARIDMQD